MPKSSKLQSQLLTVSFVGGTTEWIIPCDHYWPMGWEVIFTSFGYQTLHLEKILIKPIWDKNKRCSQGFSLPPMKTSVHARVNKFLYSLPNQWRIQDFPEEGPPNPKMGAPTYYLVKHFPTNCMKMKEFGPREGGASLASPTSANANGAGITKCSYPPSVVTEIAYSFAIGTGARSALYLDELLKRVCWKETIEFLYFKIVSLIC